VARRGLSGPSAAPRDPWRDAPTSELSDQVLPRWFVLTCLAAIPVAIAVAVSAFAGFGADEVPVAARRPPPGGGLTHDVGEYAVGQATPSRVEGAACPEIADLRVAGTEVDRSRLVEGLSALCDLDQSGVADLVRRFGDDGGVIRFAQFTETGVDSTALTTEPLILVNARFSVTDPAWIAPLVVHDLVTLDGEPGTASTELAAREAELAACTRLFPDTRPSRACDDARALLDLDDPLSALREAGYR
jgi:hypothetical protein